MIKVIALYRMPDDVEAFMDHYQNIHTPLVQKTPGLEHLEVTRIDNNAFDESSPPPYFLMCTMSYRDEVTFQAAMRSPENQAVVKDGMSFAKDLVTVVVGNDILVQ